MEKLSKNEKFLNETPWKSPKEICSAIFNTLEGRTFYNQLFIDIQHLIEEWKENTEIDCSNTEEFNHFLKSFILSYNTHIKEKDIDQENFEKSSALLQKKLETLWVKKIDLLNENDFYTLFTLHFSITYQGIMKSKMIYDIFSNISDETFDRLKNKKRELKKLLDEEKNNPEISLILAQNIQNIFIESWWITHWFQEAYKEFDYHPTKWELINAIENKFNGYLEELFGFHITDFKILDLWDYELQEEEVENNNIYEEGSVIPLFFSDQLPS